MILVIPFWYWRFGWYVFVLGFAGSVAILIVSRAQYRISYPRPVLKTVAFFFHPLPMVPNNKTTKTWRVFFVFVFLLFLGRVALVELRCFRIGN